MPSWQASAPGTYISQELLLQLISNQSPPPPAPTTPPRRWARPNQNNGGKSSSPSATKTTPGKKQNSSSTETPTRKTTPLTDQQLQDRWSKVKEGALSGKHTKVELLCQACLTTNWQTKERFRGCGAPTASSWTILPSQWPPVGVPGALLTKWDTADKDGMKGDSAESTKHTTTVATPTSVFQFGAQPTSPTTSTSTAATPPVAGSQSNTGDSFVTYSDNQALPRYLIRFRAVELAPSI